MIFDCDGVLVDTERLAVGVEARILTELGWPIGVDEVVRRFMGRTSEAMLAEVAQRLGPGLADRFDALATTESRAVFERELAPVPGVISLLDVLEAAGIATCVASSGSPDKMRFTLGLTDLLPRFTGRIFSAVEVRHGKPAPDLFLHAAEAMNTAPEECTVVEDSVSGVLAAVAAGMRVYGFAGGLAPASELAAAGATLFDRMADLAGPLTAGLELSR